MLFWVSSFIAGSILGAILRILIKRVEATRHVPFPPPKSCLDGRSEEYIRALAKLEAEIPTGDEESLAALAWVARGGNPAHQGAAPQSNLVRGSYQQLLAPGLLGGSLSAAGLGGNAQEALARAAQQSTLGGLGKGRGLGSAGSLQDSQRYLVQQAQLQGMDLQLHQRKLAEHAQRMALLALGVQQGGQKH